VIEAARAEDAEVAEELARQEAEREAAVAAAAEERRRLSQLDRERVLAERLADDDRLKARARELLLASGSLPGGSGASAAGAARTPQVAGSSGGDWELLSGRGPRAGRHWMVPDREWTLMKVAIRQARTSAMAVGAAAFNEGAASLEDALALCQVLSENLVCIVDEVESLALLAPAVRVEPAQVGAASSGALQAGRPTAASQEVKELRPVTPPRGGAGGPSSAALSPRGSVAEDAGFGRTAAAEAAAKAEAAVPAGGHIPRALNFPTRGLVSPAGSKEANGFEMGACGVCGGRHTERRCWRVAYQPLSGRLRAPR
jgi:hypothetical protein